jgi:hypothetical protein
MEGDAMRNQETHVPDHELLLLADGELSPARSAEVRSHLEACWTCRTRVQEIEGTIADFVHVHRADFDPHIPPVAGPRAMLKARLAEAAAVSQKGSWLSFARSGWVWASAVAVLAIAASFAVLHRSAVLQKSQLAAVTAGPIPNSQLTPGAVRPVTWNEICSSGYRDMNRAVSPAVQRAVFEKYGILGARTQDYEVDYLITPELGGADNIQNLWPEPYASTDWGAHVKDALESRLHQMVCEKQIDLTTAQQEMAHDWISAYKKYFHTDKPLSIDSANPAEKSENEIGDGKST